MHDFLPTCPNCSYRRKCLSAPADTAGGPPGDGRKKGAVTVLDVRPVEEYNAGHIPGAISIPLKELQLRLMDLPRDQEIVAYCRGPYCVLSIQAVEMLGAKGFQALRLEEGIQDLRALGFPIAKELDQ